MSKIFGMWAYKNIFAQSKTPSLIFEYVNNTDFRSLYPKFTDFDVRYYIMELLKVGWHVQDLEGSHANFEQGT
jgi:hypothetical protein